MPTPAPSPRTLGGRRRRTLVTGSARSLRLLIVAATLGLPGVVIGQDSQPTLLSTTGGGGWSNLAELTKAAESGNPRAQFELGENLLDTVAPAAGPDAGPAADAKRAEALRWLEKAARSGQGPAAFRLGKLLAAGEGLPRDPARALAYYRAAAAAGVPEAFYNIGAAYASGRGVKRDFAEGLGWLIAANAHGAPAADGEAALRKQIERYKRPEWITTGEARAQTIDAELAQKPAAAWLPAPAEPTPTATPVPAPTPAR